MNEMLKKLVLCLLVLALVLPAAFAGGKKDSAKAAEAVSNEPVDIEIWYGALATEAGSPPADWSVYSIVKEKLNINLKLTALPSSADDQAVKVNAAGAANNLPDLFMAERPAWLKLVDQGLVAEVDDMYAKMPVRTKTHYDATSITETTVDGHSYGLADPGSVIKNEGVLIRKDWLDNLGLKVPVTTDEFFEVMKAFTFNDPDKNGKDDTYGYGAFIESQTDALGLGRRFEPLAGAFGLAGVWDMSTGNLNIFKPEYFDYLTYVKKLIDAKVIDPNWSSYKKDDFRAAWKQGKFGIMREQNAAYAATNNYKPFDDNFPNGEWIVVDAPKGPKGLQSAGTYASTFRIYAVSQKAADAGKKAKIAELLEWMATDGYYLLGWGEEGVNFVFNAEGAPVEDGIPDPEKGFSKPAIVPLTQLRNMISYNSDAELAARYPTYKCATSGKEMSALKVLRDMQSRPWTNGGGQTLMPVPNADVKRFYEEGIVKFVTGNATFTKDTWNAFIEEFKKVGGADWNAAGVAKAKENNLLHAR